MTQKEELFEIIDKQGKILGTARRSECHGNPELMHRVVHVLVFNCNEELYLQKRSMTKDIQPGKWDTSVGGHVCPGEALETAALREMEEELGIKGATLKKMYHYIMNSVVETEWVTSYIVQWDGPVYPDPQEIEKGQFWSSQAIAAQLGKDCFTPNFEEEYQRCLDWLHTQER